ncbi:hypothetical protein P7K49_014213 [Saguinus oedipus]|uniref:Uncharacterized protein n=1 Tax=Saguinus oedipus TaxID=9490 RepID=A0ABQ9VI66_SAGOE|nr:hypothetical protein P7K49_014213 [Saguinus oedipus]
MLDSSDTVMFPITFHKQKCKSSVTEILLTWKKEELHEGKKPKKRENEGLQEVSNCREGLMGNIRKSGSHGAQDSKKQSFSWLGENQEHLKLTSKWCRFIALRTNLTLDNQDRGAQKNLNSHFV